MIYVVLSDIHGNIDALKAVVKSFPEKCDKMILCAGDIVGYGAEPGECIEVIRSLDAKSVLGNHDAAVIGKIDVSKFNETAARGIKWTMKRLSPSDRDYLNGLPFIYESKPCAVAHGTLQEPEDFIYLWNGGDAMRTFKLLNAKVCFVGHTHVSGVFKFKDGRVFQLYNDIVKMEEGAKYIINAGSIGQPRDGIRKACYCVYDTDKEEIEFRRIEYDVDTACARIINAGLPVEYGTRLLEGR